ncbi:hypothetical protein CFH99_16840 [Nocardioides aromaticivorans]|uniref:Lipoprotein n=1 Tax=Nocardioides aromaticivorans TaxID=200618 RepID=A0ABX7PMQ4_9ACTN|nr:hypothetical protein [Nocardioides aromaticivorans]QSR27289.1 hypothetical protein CFH99_16840 [Nocardioides aromaticivorans]
MIVLRPLLVLALLALSGCSHESDHVDSARPEPADGFGRRALGAIDAATSCAALQAAWDEYLDSATRASVARRVPCTRRVLATRHEVVEVLRYDGGIFFELPEGVSGAGVHRVVLEPTDRSEVDSFPLSDFLDDGWYVVTEDGRRRLLNPAIVALDECLTQQDECRMAG